jgi:hypothetical protein
MNAVRNQIKTTVMAAVMALPLMAGPAGADDMKSVIDSIRDDIRSSLVVAPANPQPVSLGESIRMQGNQAIQRIVLDAELSLYRTTHTSGIYDEVPVRSGTVTVSAIETTETPYTESY